MAMAMQCRVCPRSQATAGAKTNSSNTRHHQQQDMFYPLTCGDTYCRACLAEFARQCLLSHQLIPLRCCQRRVPLEWIEEVLEQPEFGYYRFLVDKNQRQSQNQTQAIEVDVPSVQPTTTQCAGCDLSSGRSENSPTILLECGHQYCLECLAELCRLDWDHGAAPSCCAIPLTINALHQLQELQRATTVSTVATTKSKDVSMIIIDDDEQSGVGDHTGAQSTQRRRQSKRILFGKAQAKKMRPTANEIDLVDSPELTLAAAKRPLTDYADLEAEEATEEQRTQCFTCKRLVLTSEAACGHAFCLQCLANRCRQAVKNDKDGGIGFPLRCCDEMLALEVVRPALSPLLYTQYKALLAKRKDDMKQLTKRKRGAGKLKAKSKATLKTQASSSSATITSKPPPTKRLRLSGSVVSTAAEDQKEQDEPDIVEVADHFECVACMEQLSEKAQRFRGPCGHMYCAECLELMAKKALENRLLVPIRCCGKELPLEYVARVLSRRNLTTYNHFLKEKDWKTSNLRSDKEYAKLIKTIGGVQCPRCGIGVQKITGCNAMVCPHGHRFCWGCVHAHSPSFQMNSSCPASYEEEEEKQDSSAAERDGIDSEDVRTDGAAVQRKFIDLTNDDDQALDSDDENSWRFDSTVDAFEEARRRNLRAYWASQGGTRDDQGTAVKMEPMEDEEMKECMIVIDDDDNDGIEEADCSQAEVQAAEETQQQLTPRCCCCYTALETVETRRFAPRGHLHCLPCVAARASMDIRPVRCCQREFPLALVEEALRSVYKRLSD